MNNKKLSLTIVVVGLSALAASCAGVPAIPTLPTPQPTANTVPTVSVTQTAPAPTGEFVSGIITFPGEPLPGARAELRIPGWQTNAGPAVASAVAGPDGVYRMEHPPVGDYSMIGIFPDGQIDAAAYPPVVIAAGQAITDIDITLEKELTFADGLPPSCQTKDPQYTPYAHAQQHYCFLFPAHFKMGEAGPTEPVLYGPDLDQSVEPLRATLLIEVELPAGDETLAQHVDT